MSHAGTALAAPEVRKAVRFRHVAPAGAPLRAIDLAAWLATAATPGDPHATLAAAVRARFGVACRAVSTGRAGMTILLSALARLDGGRRTDVVVPAYTCYSVAASVMKAGLTPRLVDVDPASIDYDLDALEAAVDERTLAVVATNLYGYPSDGRRIAALAARHGARVVDDAAQAMGATRDGEAAGARGDVGLFSLDKGKNVSAIDGGLIISRAPDVIDALDRELATLATPGAAHVAADAVKALAYFVLLRPWLYWLPASFPPLQLGATPFTTEFPLARHSRTLGALAVRAFGRLEALTAARRATAARLSQALAGAPGLQLIASPGGAEPVYLRLPVLADTMARREHWLQRLNAHGIGATASYPACLADVPEVRERAAGAEAPLAGARAVASRIMTLPTHPFVTEADVSRMARLLGGHG